MLRYLLAATLYLSTGLDLATGLETSADDAGALIEKLQAAAPGERPTLVAQLFEAGADALPAIAHAKEAAVSNPNLFASLERAETWILAERIAETLREGIESQLSFDGQYASLAEIGPRAIPTLLAMVDDEALPYAYRTTAIRAIADLGDASLLPRLRELHADILLLPPLREELGIVLAVFGDTYAVERELREARRYVDSERAAVRLNAHTALARLYYRIRDYERAVESYEVILELSRKIVDAEKIRLPANVRQQLENELAVRYYNAACSNALHGDLERAKKYLRQSVTLNPDHYRSIDQDGDLIRLRESKGYEEFREELGRAFGDGDL